MIVHARSVPRLITLDQGLAGLGSPLGRLLGSAIPGGTAVNAADLAPGGVMLLHQVHTMCMHTLAAPVASFGPMAGQGKTGSEGKVREGREGRGLGCRIGMLASARVWTVQTDCIL